LPMHGDLAGPTVVRSMLAYSVQRTGTIVLAAGDEGDLAAQRGTSATRRTPMPRRCARYSHPRCPLPSGRPPPRPRHGKSSPRCPRSFCLVSAPSSYLMRIEVEFNTMGLVCCDGDIADAKAPAASDLRNIANDTTCHSVQPLDVRV